MKALRHLFETKRAEYDVPGKLLVRLDSETDGKFGPAILKLALESMEARREITLYRAGQVFNGVKYTPKSKPQTPPVTKRLDLTPIPVAPKERKVPKLSDVAAAKKPAGNQPWSPLDKRTRELTRGIPDYLEDHQCSPVTVTKMATLPPPVELPSEPAEESGRERITSLENVKLAIKTLRERCNSENILQARSGADVLEEVLGLQTKHAIYLFAVIGKLGYKASVREGRGWKTLVEMTPEDPDITEEMVSAAILNLTPSKVRATAPTNVVESVAEDAVEDINPEPEIATESTEALSTPDELLLRMATIIQDLESNCAEQERQNESLRDCNRELSLENEELRTKNRELTEQMGQKTLISTQVADIIHRYQK